MTSPSEAAKDRVAYNVYCDESCHLEFDHQPCMVLGALWCRTDRVRAVADDLRAIKAEHGLARQFETKWIKVSGGKLAFYEALISYFAASPDLFFRGLVATHKERLNPAAWSRDHDDWYYVMYYEMLRVLGAPERELRVYLDIKDTRSQQKILRLSEYLSNAIGPIGGSLTRIQTIRSHESELLQLADLVIGAIAYANRGLSGLPAKTALVSQLETTFGRKLTIATPKSRTKFNLFLWTPQ
jgi:hypothetical protein